MAASTRGTMGSSAAAPQLRAALIDHRCLTRTPHSLASARLAIADLSGDLARRRIGARSAVDIFRRLRNGSGTFLYPRRGYGQISETAHA